MNGADFLMASIVQYLVIEVSKRFDIESKHTSNNRSAIENE